MSEAICTSNLMADFTEPTFVKWDAETENTPYKVDLTECTDGFALVYGDAENHTITAWTKGGENYDCYMHNVSNGVVKEWNVLHGDKVLYTTGGTMTGPLGLGDGKGTVSADEEGAYLEAAKDSENYTGLKVVNPSNEDADIINSVKVYSSVDGNKQEFNVFGEHNASALGIAKIATCSYVGTDTYGEDNPNSLTFPFKPKLIMVTGGYRKDLEEYHPMAMLISSTHQYNTIIDCSLLSNEYRPKVGFGSIATSFGKMVGSTFYWYNTTNNSYQFNASACTYYVVAIG
jgi:hypothetical protein